MVRREKTFVPIAANVSLYQKVNETVYRDLTKTTDQVLEKAYSVFGEA